MIVEIYWLSGRHSNVLQQTVSNVLQQTESHVLQQTESNVLKQTQIPTQIRPIGPNGYGVRYSE